MAQCSARVQTMAAGCQQATGWARLELTGKAPFEIAWPDGYGDRERHDLAPGTYNVTVKDGSGCQAVVKVNIAKAAPLDIKINAQAASHTKANDGLLQAQVAGGASPYQLDWKYLMDTSQVFSGDNKQARLRPGLYRLMITDANGCTVIKTATVSARKR